MKLLSPTQPSLLPTNMHRGAANIGRSRLSSGSSQIRTRPQKLFRAASRSSLHRIPFNVGSDPLELRPESNQMIIAFLLPKRSMRPQEQIGLVSRESLKWPQPLGSRHVRRSQDMNMIRHHDERMEFIPVQFLFAVPQRIHHHRRNLRPPQGQRAAHARVQKPVDRHERLACRDESGRREHAVRWKTAVQSEGHEQRLLDHVPVWQTPFIMPHTSSWCFGSGETLTALSRLKAGCGHYCPPHGAL